MKFDISVIIPAWNEEKHIESAIRAIQEQDFKGSYEIIVVDNNSTDNTFQKALDMGVTVVKQEIQGTNATRQAGFEKSQGAILAYCDADCIPPKRWLTNIYGYLQNERRAAVSGPYEFGETKGSKLFESLYSKVFCWATDLRPFGKPIAIMIGGNFGVKREALVANGGFPDIAFWGDDTCLALELTETYGPVWFTYNLKVKSSPRRFQSKGRFSWLTSPFVGVWTSVKYLYAFFKIWIPFDPKNPRPRANARIKKHA